MNATWSIMELKFNSFIRKDLAVNANKFWIFVFLAFFFSSSATADYYCYKNAEHGHECEIYYVSIINLIVTPERFHGKKVKVLGYFVINNGYVTLRYAKQFPFYSEALNLSFAEKLSFLEMGSSKTEDIDNRENDLDRFREFNGKRVMIDGVFDMENMRNRGIYFGIRNITQIEKIAE
jgi:hypothetical protein